MSDERWRCFVAVPIDDGCARDLRAAVADGAPRPTSPACAGPIPSAGT